MAMVTAVLAVVFMSVYFSVQRSAETLSRQVLQRVIQEADQSHGEGIFRPDISITIGGDRVLLPYFTVEVWGNNAYVTGGTYASLDDTEALSYILQDCLSQPQQEGIVERYGLRYLRQDNLPAYKRLYCFLSYACNGAKKRMNQSNLAPEIIHNFNCRNNE